MPVKDLSRRLEQLEKRMVPPRAGWTDAETEEVLGHPDFGAFNRDLRRALEENGAARYQSDEAWKGLLARILERYPALKATEDTIEERVRQRNDALAAAAGYSTGS